MNIAPMKIPPLTGLRTLCLLFIVLLMGCDRPFTWRTKAFLRAEERLLAEYSGPDLVKAEDALGELRRLAKVEQDAGNPELSYEWIYGTISGRLFMIYRKLGETNRATKAFQESKRHFLSQPDLPFALVSDQQATQSIERLDMKLNVLWKR
jgi:hypothetical protein